MGLVGLINVLRQEGAKYNITANAVAPIARTRMTEDLLGPLAEHFDPELVTPAVLYLASEDCTLSGDVWSVGAGSITRVFVGQTGGWFKHPVREGAVTVENIAEHEEEIRSVDDFTIPHGVQDDIIRIGGMLGG
jgi:hypothetical protein